MDQVEVAVVLSDRDGAEEIAAAARAADPDSDPEIGEQRGLAGGAAEWVVFAGVARALGPLLEAIRRQVGLGRVSMVKVGDVEIRNPRNSDVDRLLELAFAREERRGSGA